MAAPRDRNGPAQGARRTARGEATRARLLAAAETSFAERGFYAAAVSQITVAAGVGLGTFYFYFPSKLDCFRAVLAELGRALRHEMKVAAAAAESRIEAEYRAFAAFFAFATRHKNLYRMLSQAEWVDPSLSREYYEAIARPYSHILAGAAARGEIRRLDPETLAHCLIGAAEGVNRRWGVWDGTEPPPRALQAMKEFLAAALRPQTKA